MPLGPKTPDWIETEIVRIYQTSMKSGILLSAKEVRAQLAHLLEDEPKEYLLPGIRKVQKTLKEARKGEEESKKLAKYDIDGPWNLAASGYFNIPPEANGDILKINRWCIVVGWPFSIREAMWVARLRSVRPIWLERLKNPTFPNSDDRWLSYLLNQACKYAAEERACDALGQKIDSTYLDAILVLLRSTNWELDTAHATATLPPTVRHEAVAGQEPLRREILTSMEWPAGVAVQLALQLDFKRRLWPGVEKYYRLSGSADLVYAMWLRKISQSPAWASLDDTQKRQIMESLHDEVADQGKWVNRELEAKQQEWKNSLLEMRQLEDKEESGNSLSREERDRLIHLKTLQAELFSPHRWKPERVLRELGLG